MKFKFGDRVKNIYSGQVGIVIDPYNPDPKPAHSFSPDRHSVYVKLDHSNPFRWFYPYAAFHEKDLELIESNCQDIGNNHQDIGNNCSDCNIPGEFVNWAYKCPKCWKVW